MYYIYNACFRLRKWYTAANHLENVKFLSRSSGGDFNTPLYTFREMTEARLGEKLNFTDSYKVVATINLIRVENSIYKACPIDSCRKKVSYICESCIFIKRKFVTFSMCYSHVLYNYIY